MALQAAPNPGPNLCTPCSSAAFSADGKRLITAGYSGAFQVWDAETGDLIRGVHHGAAINVARLSPDGAIAITAGDDGVARLWDSGTGRELGIIRGHGEAITHAELTRDGKTLVTAARDGTVRVSSLAQAQMLHQVDALERMATCRGPGWVSFALRCPAPEADAPFSAAAYVRRGDAYGNKGDLDRAIADYNEALRLDPQWTAAYASRGDAYAGKKEYERAIADYDEALKLKPDLAKTRQGRERAQAALAASPTVVLAPPSLQLHYIVRPAASAALPGWTSDRMAKRLLALIVSTRSEFLLKMRDGTEILSSAPPELTQTGDAAVVWSGDWPEGPTELVFRGVEGLELVPQTQSAEPLTAPATLTDPRIRVGDFVSFAEFRIAAPFFYDQWQARIEAVTKVYGQEQPDAVDDLCQFSLLIPRTGWLSFLTGPISVGLERIDERGKRILQSAPVILPAHLMRASGEPLHLDVQPTAADKACISQSKRLAPFTTATGNATAAWKLSEMPDNPSTGRMDIRPSSLMTRGRWLLGLYGPQNIVVEVGSRAAADAQDPIFKFLTAFLDDFHERNFQRRQPESQAIGSDLALISSADAGSTAFSEKSVVIGRFRQPPPQTDLFRLDAEGSRRLSAFRSGPGNAGGELSFRSVGQTIRHYSQLFGELSGQKPPIAIYVGAARAALDSCVEWKKMTAGVARLSGRPRVLGMVFANASAEQVSQQLGQNGRGNDIVLASGIRTLTCDGESGSSLLFVSFPDLLSHPPETMLQPAFNVIGQWAGEVQN